MVCWLALRDLAPDVEDDPGEIVRAVKRSRIVVVVVSQHASQSRHVAREMTIAVNREVRMLP